MSNFSRLLLSGSTNGLPISVTATSSPGTTLHVAGTSVYVYDEVYLWASNLTSNTINVTIEWGGYTDPTNHIVKSYPIPPNSQPVPIVTGQVIQNGLTVSCFASSTGINITGHVNRITPGSWFTTIGTATVSTPRNTKLTNSMWGSVGHANISNGNTYVPFVDKLLEQGHVVNRLDSGNLASFVSTTGAFTAMSYWTATNGLQAQLILNSANSINSLCLLATPGIAQDPSGVNTADMLNYTTQYVLAIQPYTNYFSMANESNNAAAGYSTSLLNLYAAVVPQLRSAQPNFKHVGPDGTWGFANSSRNDDFWRDPRADAYVDIASLHLYDASRGAETIMSAVTPTMISAIPTGKPKWLTECGWRPTDACITAASGGASSDTMVGFHLAKNYVLMSAIGMDAIIPYQLKRLSSSDETYKFYHEGSTLAPQGTICKDLVTRCNNAVSYRTYGTSTGTFWSSKMEFTGASDKLLTWDNAAAQTHTYDILASGSITLNILPLGGSTSVTSLSAGINSVQVAMTSQQPYLLYANSGRVIFYNYQ